MNLTLSMIVKNEEKYLEGCLNSVCDITNEIVIVDTGSTDKTLKIAKKTAERLRCRDRANDFTCLLNPGESKLVWVCPSKPRDEERGRSVGSSRIGKVPDNCRFQ